MRDNWQTVRLGDLCTIKGRIGFRGYTRQDLVEKGEGAITLSPSNIVDDKLNLDKCQYISWFKYDESPEIMIFEGDIIYAKTASIGKVALVKDLPEKATINPQFVVFKNIKCNRSFLYYAVRSHGFKEQVSLITNGVAIPTVSQSNLEKLHIKLPSVSEQQRIVDELDLLTGIIEKKNAQLRDLDALAQSIFYEMFGDPAVNEKGWPVKQISDLFDVGSSKRVFESEWRDSGVPFYRAREIVRLSKGLPLEDPIFIEESLFAAYKEKYGIPAAGDIMVTGVGTLGICYLVKEGDRFYFKDGNTLWFKDKHISNSRFIKDQFLTEFVKDQIKGNSHGATVGTYTIVNAKKTRVICPPVKLQNEYEERVNAIDSQKRVIGKSLTETQNLLDSRMHNYFG